MPSFNQLLKKKNEEQSLVSRNKKSVGTASIATEIDKIMLVEIKNIVPNINQPRQNFEENESIKNLAESIKEVGLQSPIVVNQTGEKYQILIGHRRYYAYKKYIPEEPKIKCIVWNKEKMSDDERDEIALVENLQRENLSRVEIAETLHKLNKDKSFNVEKIAKLTGYKRSQIFDYIRCQKAIINNEITRDQLKKLGVHNCIKILKDGDSPDSGLREKNSHSKLKKAKKNSKSFQKVIIKDTEKLEELQHAQKTLENQLTIVKRFIKKIGKG